ncbi:MAG: copper oxidase [Rhodospirillales bacterium 20-60-12]|nr:MAG: copper oxidase [Rhodospirillales bacterium 20-60-12]HQT67967.1 multicopper oxidase family protein [Acetobacteraceae bacterium]HQU00836.1 multicopper oxidase family protein [Acetobacteraceae bacterium]
MLELSRRHLLASAASLTAWPLAARAANAPIDLNVVRRSIEVNGKSASKFAILGPDGKPGLTLQPGQTFRVNLHNQINEPTIIHWHGQIPPWQQDGVAWADLPPIAAGASRSYDYQPIAGTFWMHSHQGMQEQDLMAAPLIIRNAADVAADRQDIVLMLHDFSFKSPQELMAGLTKAGAPSGGMGNMGGMSGMSGMGNMSGMSGMGGMSMDLNDVKFDAYLANDRTLNDPDVVPVDKSGQIRLRIINGASASNMWIDLGALSGTLVAVDGVGVQPLTGSTFPIAIAQRLDILLTLPASGAFPILAQIEGLADRTGIILATAGATVPRISARAGQNAPPVDGSLETRLRAAGGLAPRAATRQIDAVLSGSMSPFSWAINHATWPGVQPMMVSEGERVEINFINRSMMSHPMHLHGHHFQVVKWNGQTLAGAMRDTVLVPPMARVTIAFDADHKGRWLLHCHNMYHQMAGMMTVLDYQGVPVPALT